MGLVAIGLGAAAAFTPLALVPAAALLVFIAAGRKPGVLLTMGIFLPLLVSSGLINQVLSTGAGATLQKIAVAAFLFLTMAVVGTQAVPASLWWILAVFAVSLWYTVAALTPEISVLTKGEAARAALGYALPWLVFFLRWRGVTATQLMRVIGLLPAAALVVGVGLQVAGIHQLIWDEYTGAQRLTAGLAAAYLGAFGMFGTFAALWLWRSGHRRALWLALANIAVTFGTGTRGPALTALAMLWLSVIFTGRGGRRVSVMARGAVLAVALAAVAVFLPVLVARTFDQGSVQGPLSGRDQAWAFFYKVFLRHPIAGNGVGFSSVAAEESRNGNIVAAFVAPHNTYLQFLVDFGVVGLAVALLAAIALFRYARKNTTGHTRLMVGVLGLCVAFYAFFDNLLTSPQPAFAFTLTLAALLHAGREEAASGEDFVDSAVGVAGGPDVVAPAARLAQANGRVRDA